MDDLREVALGYQMEACGYTKRETDDFLRQLAQQEDLVRQEATDNMPDPVGGEA